MISVYRQTDRKTRTTTGANK